MARGRSAYIYVRHMIPVAGIPIRLLGFCEITYSAYAFWWYEFKVRDLWVSEVAFLCLLSKNTLEPFLPPSRTSVSVYFTQQGNSESRDTPYAGADLAGLSHRLSR